MTIRDLSINMNCVQLVSRLKKRNLSLDLGVLSYVFVCDPVFNRCQLSFILVTVNSELI